MPDDRKQCFEGIPPFSSPNKTGLLLKVPQKLHETKLLFVFFYRKILDISSLFSIILTEKDYGIDTKYSVFKIDLLC